MNKHFRVSGSILLKLEELGVRASAVLRKAGLPQGLFDQARVLLTTEEFFAAMSFTMPTRAPFQSILLANYVGQAVISMAITSSAS